ARGRHQPDRSVIAFLLLVHRHAHKRHPTSIRRDLRVADPDKIEKISLGDETFLRGGDGERCNDECEKENRKSIGHGVKCWSQAWQAASNRLEGRPLGCPKINGTGQRPSLRT